MNFVLVFLFGTDMKEKKTMVLGASDNPTRYAFTAVHQLLQKGHEVVPVGYRSGEIGGIPILTQPPNDVDDIDTVTLYLNPQRQQAYYDYLLALKPRRIIFNPGTVNSDLITQAKAAGIEAEVACTLVLLSTDQY